MNTHQTEPLLAVPLHRLVRNFPRVDSEPGKILKYKPQSEPKSPDDLEVAKDAVMQIIVAFQSNFQNDETDLARLLTDRFTLRSDIPNDPHHPRQPGTEAGNK